MLQCHPDPPIHSLECPKRGQKPGKLPFLRWTASPFPKEKEKNNCLKMKERSGNVIENKGSVFPSPERSGNVIENKGGCALKAGMSLKTRMLAVSLNPFSAQVAETDQAMRYTARSKLLRPQPGFNGHWTFKLGEYGSTWRRRPKL